MPEGERGYTVIPITPRKCFLPTASLAPMPDVGGRSSAVGLGRTPDAAVSNKPSQGP